MHKFEWTVNFASSLKRRILEESRTGNESRASQNLYNTKGSYKFIKAIKSMALSANESQSASKSASFQRYEREGASAEGS